MKAREITFCALFIALITAGTFVRIPVGTDVYTLQFLATLLAGLVLGGRLGGMAVGGYVLLGLIGVPVFASGGGFGYVLQPTFGYLLGFIVQAMLCGVLARKDLHAGFKKLLAINILGMTVVYLFGMTWFYFVSNYVADVQYSLWWVVLYLGILQFPADFLLCIGAAYLGLRLRRAQLWIVSSMKNG